MELIKNGTKLDGFETINSIICNGYTCDVYTPGGCPIVCNLVEFQPE